MREGENVRDCREMHPLSFPPFDLTTLRYSANPRFHSSHSPYAFAGVQSYFTRCPVLPAEWARGRSRRAGCISFCVYVRDAYVTAMGTKTGKSQGRLILREISVKCRLCNPRGRRMFAFVTFERFLSAPRSASNFLDCVKRDVIFLYGLRLYVGSQSCHVEAQKSVL